jgi:hypothetical protein
MKSLGEARLGSKVRGLRRKEALSQAALAEKLGISASYLNLIESDRRPLTAPLLIKLAQVFKIDIASFAGVEEGRMLSDMLEVFGDPLFEEHGLTNQDLRELSSSAPGVSRAVVALYQAYRAAQEQAGAMAERLSDGEVSSLDRSRLPSEEVSDFIQRQMNYFPQLEEAAEALWRDGKLDQDDLYRSLTWHLKRQHGVDVRVTSLLENRGAVRRFDPVAHTLVLSETLPPRSRNFEVASQLCLIQHASLLDELASDRILTVPESRRVCRVAMASYFAGAVLMPYERFLQAARAVRYDIELLGHRFRVSFEQVCHRLTTLQRPGAEGVPFHLIRIDIAGNISKRFSASGIRFARFAGACPRWNVFAAFQTPGMIKVQLSEMNDGAKYLCLARSIRKEAWGYNAPHAVHAIGLGCQLKHARELVYADGIDLENEAAYVPVGVSCRMCNRTDCTQRAFPSMQRPLQVNEDVRGVSFYAPADD